MLPMISQHSGGSSPHTRGAPDDPDALIKRAGIIPAYAGSTHVIDRLAANTGDHPRIRGEHHFFAGHLKNAPGSSPHTRGALGA